MNSENILALVSKSLRHRLMLCRALCSIAETEVRDGESDRALQTMRSLRKRLAEVTVLISEPQPLPIRAASESAALLAELESRASALEAALARPTLP